MDAFRCLRRRIRLSARSSRSLSGTLEFWSWGLRHVLRCRAQLAGKKRAMSWTWVPAIWRRLLSRTPPPVLRLLYHLFDHRPQRLPARRRGPSSVTALLQFEIFIIYRTEKSRFSKA